MGKKHRELTSKLRAGGQIIPGIFAGFFRGKNGDCGVSAKSLTQKKQKNKKRFAECKVKPGKRLQSGLHVCSILPAQNSARKKTSF